MPRLRRVGRAYQLRENSDTKEEDEHNENQNQNRNRNISNDKRLVQVHAIPSALLRLPSELILQVAHILAAPGLTIQRWDQPNSDLINFSATCSSIRSLTRSLLYNQLTVTIERTNPNRSLARAIKRIKELAHPSRQISPVKKLFIKDDGPDLTNSHKTRQSWYSSLVRSLDLHLHSLQFFCYSRNLESVTESSPYEQLTIDPSVINSLSKLKHLNTLYLSGLTLEQRSSRRTPSTQFNTFQGLNTLHLIAVHDSILKLVRSCRDLRELRIWRDFLIPFPSIQHWFDPHQWSTLEHLKIKGFYGNSVVSLQNSLIETRQTISTTDLKMNLNTLDLDEPYSTNDVLRLLEAFKSSCLVTLRLTVWRDEDFSPTLFEKIADFFPNLEDFQIVLETPLRRWWPHKINSWAQSLSKMSKLRRFTWNCSPFTCHDLIHIQAGMKSQVMILAKLIPTLERVAYVDVSGWLEIQRKTKTGRNKKTSTTVQSTPGPSSQQSVGHVKSIRWAGVKFTYPFLGSNGFFDSDSDSEDVPDEEEEEEEEEEKKVEAIEQATEKDRWSSPRGEGEKRKVSRRRSMEDPFSVPRTSSNPSRIPNSSLTSRLTRLSSSVSSQPGFVTTSNTTGHLKTSSSSSSTTTTTTTHHRLVNSHSYPDLLISQILEINRAKVPSRSRFLPSNY